MTSACGIKPDSVEALTSSGFFLERMNVEGIVDGGQQNRPRGGEKERDKTNPLVTAYRLSMALHKAQNRCI